MGTSLKVHGLKKLVKDFARAIHSSAPSSGASSSKRPYKVIFVNKTAPSSEWADIIDYHISGETDRWTNKVIEDWKKIRPADWEIQQTLDGDGEIAVGGGLKTVKSLASSTLSKTGKPGSERENIAPPTVATATKEPIIKGKPIPPLSPSKRRQKSSHYDDLQSSPSKRHSSSRSHLMPSSERKMLFAETTNKQPPLILDTEKSKMDISLCDLSMQDVELKYQSKCGPKSSAAEIGTSKMDISSVDLSMLEGEIIPVKPLLVKTTRKATKKSQESQRRPATKRPVRRRKPTQPQELEAH
jgi:NAD-dependent histone deacetylase SIR2